MANLFPVALNGGTITVMGSSSVVNPALFPMSRSVAPTSNSFATLLPDPYFIQTQSAAVTVTTNGASSSLMSFAFPTRPEKQYYISDGLLAVSTANSTLTGPKVSVNRTNIGDGFYRFETATSLITSSVFFQGSKDVNSTASMTRAVANNTFVPIIFKGLTFNSTSNGIFNNTIFLDTSASVSVTAQSGSVFNNQFAGISSSLAPFTSSRSPLALVGGTLNSIAGGDLINQGCLPATKSLWANTATALLLSTVTTNSATSWTPVFTLTGMTDGKRYLVNAFLRVSTTATATACYVRAASASNYNGFIQLSLDQTNHKPYATATSSGSVEIANKVTTGISSINADRVYPSEYTLTKTVGLNPTIEIQSETAGTNVFIQSGSMVFWRLLE